MTAGTIPTYIYIDLLNRYISRLPFWRRFLATFFERYRVTKKEFENRILTINAH